MCGWFKCDFEESFLRPILRQLSGKQLLRYGSTYLSLVGTFYTLIKIAELIVKAKPDCVHFSEFWDKVQGVWLVPILLFLAALSILLSYKKIKSVYAINGKEVKIVFDYCDVDRGIGHRVIEIGTNFCLDKTKIGTTNDMARFKEKFHKMNGSLDLGKILKDSINAYGFKAVSSGKGKRSNYPLGIFATDDFDGVKYIFATSIKRDESDKEVGSDADLTEFLTNFWKNIAVQGWSTDVLRIPVFSGAGHYTWSIKMRIYWIIRTFITAVKDGQIPCRELHICINNAPDHSKDLDTFKSLSQYIDDFETVVYDGGKRIGKPIDVET